MRNPPSQKTTPLHALQVELRGKMVPFAGYEMAVNFPLGVLGEHNYTRAAAGLFDVSHMGQFRLHGADRVKALESLLPADIATLAPGAMRYSQLTNDQGGIIDDLIVTNAGDCLFLVVNGTNKDGDLAHIQAAMPAGVSVERGLLCLALRLYRRRRLRNFRVRSAGGSTGAFVAGAGRG